MPPNLTIENTQNLGLVGHGTVFDCYSVFIFVLIASYYTSLGYGCSSYISQGHISLVMSIFGYQ